MPAVCQLPEKTSFTRNTYNNDSTVKKSVTKTANDALSSNEDENPLVTIAAKAKSQSSGSQKISKDVKASRDFEGRNGVRSGQAEFHVMKQRITRYTRKNDSAKPSKVSHEDMSIPALHQVKSRCGWITSQSSADCIAYHDEEWGVPVHGDRELFELLVLVGAQAEFIWPTILSKRDAFRIAFADFDVATIAAFDEEKVMWLASNSKLMQHEGKVRGVVANAKCIIEVSFKSICQNIFSAKISKQFGSFDKYIWRFVNYKPIVSNYHYPRQIPVKTPKSECISKDLMKRGFRFVGPTIMYSFMQAVGMTNNHLAHCFRHRECAQQKRTI